MAENGDPGSVTGSDPRGGGGGAGPSGGGGGADGYITLVTDNLTNNGATSGVLTVQPLP